MHKKQSQEEWYILLNGQTRGPMGARDLDVLLRTNEINTSTYAWCNGMKEWRTLASIDELTESIHSAKAQLEEIKKEAEQGKPDKKPQQDEIIENKDEDPMLILAATVESLLKRTFHQSEDGMWNVYDEDRQVWTKEEQEPTDKIEKMKHLLMSKLKNQLFCDGKKRKREEEVLTEEQVIKREKNKKKTRRAAEKKKQKWYNPKINTFIYISGLPLDITSEELKEFVSRAGVLRTDPVTNEAKVKVYRDEEGYPKGDAAVSYVKEQSVEIALENLNNSEIRSGFPVKIEKAQFNQKNEDYKRREAKKVTMVQKIQLKKNEGKKLTWVHVIETQDEQIEQEGVGLRIVVLKYIFNKNLSEADIEEIKRDVQEELNTIGQVVRVRHYESHPDGVVEVKFKTDKEAEECILKMNQRYFGGREIQCDYWDGVTDFKKNQQSLIRQEMQLQKYGENIEGEEVKQL